MMHACMHDVVQELALFKYCRLAGVGTTVQKAVVWEPWLG